MDEVTPIDIAEWFLSRFSEDGSELTHLKLQKLLYYAQAWSLALDGRELFSEDFQAWAHGPVVPSVWHSYKPYGWDDLPVPDECPAFDENTEDLLEAVYGAYHEYSAKTLERMTHREEPWLTARGSLPAEAASSKKIPKSHMKKFYSSLLEK